MDEICALPVTSLAAATSHLYLWTPNALLPDALRVMEAGLHLQGQYRPGTKSGKMADRTAGASAFISGDVTELILFGTRGKNARALAPGRSQVNMVRRANVSTAGSRRVSDHRGHVPPARIWNCSLSRRSRAGYVWGNQANAARPTWDTYAHNSAILKVGVTMAEVQHAQIRSKLLEQIAPSVDASDLVASEPLNKKAHALSQSIAVAAIMI